MKFLPTLIAAMVRPAATRRNLRFLGGFFVILALLVAVFTVLFHVIMLWEDQAHSWLSGLYWVLVTMSTLGFGDITFKSDIGRLFSVVVLVSGMVFLLALLPFTFIEFFYSPFVKAQQAARAPREVPARLRDHVILTNFDAVTAAFIRQLKKFRVAYVLVVNEVERALQLHDEGIDVVVADLDDPASFERCGFERAAMVAATGDDFSNTSIVFTARQLSKKAILVATANVADSVDVLRLAGCTHVLQLGETLGSALARRTLGADAQAHEIGSFGELRVAEAMVAGTPLVGKTLAQSKLRETVGVTVAGLWQRGRFLPPAPDAVLTADTMLVLAGSAEQMETYNGLFCIYHQPRAPIIVIGAGRVGRAAAKAFAEMEVDYRVIERSPERVWDPEKYIVGSAADLATLERAGIRDAPAVVITTRDDAVNIYLSIYCRKLRPDIQIVARANREANVARLHSAGADVVMSYAAMGSNMLVNLFRRENTLLVAEGLNVIRVQVPTELAGRTIRESSVRSRTGCSIIALRKGGALTANPDPDMEMAAGDELIVIGTLAAEDAFFQAYKGIEGSARSAA